MSEKKKGFPEMEKILLSILSRPESEAFREPVDHEGLRLTDYLQVVKTPMDLGTIQTKYENDEYETVEEMANDIRLVWTNCMLYNCDGSEYYHLAENFAKAFEEAYAALNRLESSRDNNRIPTLEERMQLSYDIFKIDNIEMGRVLTMIEHVCPSALARKTSQDEVLINLDALTPQCFHEVNKFVCNCLLQHSGGKKKKRPTLNEAVASGAISGTTKQPNKKAK